MNGVSCSKLHIGPWTYEFIFGLRKLIVVKVVKVVKAVLKTL